MMNSARTTLRYSLVLFLFALPVMRANASGNAILAGLEFFNWQEFDSGGQRLLSEHGLRYLLSVENEGHLRGVDSVSYRLHWRGYTGDVDYDGQTQAPDNIYVSTTTGYMGWGLEGGIQYHLDANRHNLQPALALAVGIDSWSRNLKYTTDAHGNPVSGGTEDYQILYGRLGIQLEHPGEYWTGILNVGIKYPFKTDEKVSGLNLSLEPGKSSSVYINYRLNSNTLSGNRHFINLAYEAYRFDASPVIKGWQQPESHQNTFSLMLGTSF